MYATERVLKLLVLDNGKCPFQEWQASLRSKDIVASAKIDVRLTRLQAGNFGDHKKFDGIVELRIDYGPGYRIYLAEADTVLIVLLVGGDKKSQTADIAQAKELWEANQDAVERFR